MPVGTGISAQQGILSISETKRNHMGQGLGNAGVEAKQLLFLSSKIIIVEVMSWGIVM